MAPADVWLAASEEWFTPPDIDGNYQSPLTAWGNGRFPLMRDGVVVKRFSPQSTTVVKLLRHLYDDDSLQAAWDYGWRWETQAPAKMNHRFFPPQEWLDRFDQIPSVLGMKSRGPKVGLSSPETIALLEGYFGDAILSEPRGEALEDRPAQSQTMDPPDTFGWFI